MTDHTKLIGWIGNLARFKLKGNCPFNLNNRVQLVRDQVVADVSFRRQSPLTAKLRRRSAVHYLVNGVSIIGIMKPLGRTVLFVRIGGGHPDGFGSAPRLGMNDMPLSRQNAALGPVKLITSIEKPSLARPIHESAFFWSD